jgi:hypothetical protein
MLALAAWVIFRVLAEWCKRLFGKKYVCAVCKKVGRVRQVYVNLHMEFLKLNNVYCCLGCVDKIEKRGETPMLCFHHSVIRPAQDNIINDCSSHGEVVRDSDEVQEALSKPPAPEVGSKPRAKQVIEAQLVDPQQDTVSTD